MCFQNVSDWRSPLGDPVASTDGHSLCVNYRSDYTLAYDDLMMAPAWIAFNVNLVRGGDGDMCVCLNH